MNRNDSFTAKQRQQVYHFICDVTTITYPLDSMNSSIILVSMAFNILIGLLVIILNSLVISTISRKPILHCASNFLLLNAAIADFLCGIIGIPLFTANFLFVFINKNHSCILFTIMIGSIHFLGILSLWILTMVAIDRYIAVFKPYSYHHFRFDYNRYVHIVMCLWIMDFTFMVAALTLRSFNAVLVFEACCFFVAGALSSIIHLRIYRKTRSVVRDISKMHRCTKKSTNNNNNKNNNNINSNNTNNHNSNNNMDNTNNSSNDQIDNNNNNNNSNKDVQKKKYLFRQEAKVTLLTFLMLASMVVCYVPYGIVTINWLFGIDGIWIHVLNKWAFTFISFKSFANPIIYCYSLSSIRKAVKEIVCGCFCRETKEVSANISAAKIGPTNKK